MYRIILLVILVLIPWVNGGVMQITFNNLRNVLATYEQLLILFHNPQCSHSRKYVELFLKIDSHQKLGIVDCLRQIQLCHQYNFKYFPTLTKMTSQKSIQIVDEQEFLVQNGLRGVKDDQAVLNKFIKHLESDPFYAVVVFEDQQLPTIINERILESQQKIFYLQPYSDKNPSKFTKLLSDLVHNRPGCWIFKKNSQNRLEKYYCDSGYSKSITLKYLNLFKQGKLKVFAFSQESQANGNDEQLNNQQLSNILNNSDESYCHLIYVFSNYCVSCSEKDFENIQFVIKSLGLSRKIFLKKFKIDQNQIPLKLVEKGLKRVPQLISVCKKKVKVFGQVFFIESIRKFVDQGYLGINQVRKTQKVSNTESLQKLNKSNNKEF